MCVAIANSSKKQLINCVHLVIGVLEICENFNATILKNWIIKIIADYFYRQYTNPEVKSCFSSRHQQDIEEIKPYHLSFVEKLKASYLTL